MRVTVGPEKETNVSVVSWIARWQKYLSLGLGVSLLLPWSSFALPAHAAPGGAPQITIRPGSEVLMGDAVSVEVTGLTPGQDVAIHARRRDPDKQLWYSRAAFTADSSGRVSTAESAATGGAYAGVDPAGLFWSMEVMTDTTKLPGFLPPLPVDSPTHTEIVFDVEVAGKVAASGKIVTLSISPDVTREPVKANGLVADFFYPSGKSDLPVVIVVGGSEGGIDMADFAAGLLASKGYAALALAYFRAPGLPEVLQEIPLEYFGRAIDWVSSQPVVNKEKLALFGTSKGAELVLLLGATYPAVKSVVAVSPSSVVWQGMAQNSSAPGSSWTYRSQPIPFVPYKVTDEFNRQFASGMPAQIDYLSLYAEGLKDRSAVKAALIKVENIAGPVLLFSGNDDHMWPSEAMCRQIMDELKAGELTADSRHFNYPDAGHLFGIPGYLPEQQFAFVQGGTPQGNGKAQAALWPAAIQFLDENLR